MRSTPGWAGVMLDAQPGMHVLARRLAFPEGPAFAPDGALWCVTLKGGALVRIAGTEVQTVSVGGAPNGLAIDRAGRLWFCDADACAIRRFDPSTGTCEVVVASTEGRLLNRPNDLAFDKLGRLVFTCPGESRQEPTGELWRVDRDGFLTRIAEGLYFPNGLAFADDGTTLVVAETYRQRLWRGSWDLQTGTWEKPFPFAALGGPVGPDGMALAADGALLVAIYGQSAVKRLASNGQLEAGFRTPGAHPTNCAFDPSGRLGLVVTEAERGEVLSFPSAGEGTPLFAP